MTPKSLSTRSLPTSSHRFLAPLIAVVVLGSCSKGVSDNGGAGGSDATGASWSGGNVGSGGSNPSAGGAQSSGGSGGNPGAGGGSGSMAGMGGDDGAELRFYPSTVQLSKLANENDGFKLLASSLISGANGAEFYASVENQGEETACDPSMSVEFYDGEGQSMAAWLGGLHGGHLYQAGDGSGAGVACVESGESAMVAMDNLPANVLIEEVASIVYYFAHFNPSVIPFDLVPIAPLSVTDVSLIETAAGPAFAGKLINGMNLDLESPSVTLFPLNRVGRPLGVARSSSDTSISAGESWDFETDAVSDEGQELAVFPVGSITVEP